MKDITQDIKRELVELQQSNSYRSLRSVDGPASVWTRVNNKDVLLLSSNNYLGLANNPQVIAASVNAIKKYGNSTASSRLVSGNCSLYLKLEKRLAEYKEMKAALLYSCGYMANLGVISVLCNKKDIIFSDKLNHASIVDACRISGAQVKRYAHKNTDHLISLIKGKELMKFRRRIIITDSIFSMDGDLGPIERLIKISKDYDTLLIVDDAHATGVMGDRGRGIMDYLSINSGIDIIMSTLGKAIGTYGAFVATNNKEVIDLLINKSRNLIFTTGLPPGVLAASKAAVDIIMDDFSYKNRLWDNVNYLHKGLKGLGFNTLNCVTHIIPILIGENKKAIDFSNALMEKGIYAPAIRPPAVPKGWARIRITPTAGHTESDLEFALKVFKDVGQRYKII